jgi:hypothetical protein
VLLAEVKNAEDVILKAVRLAIDEQKAQSPGSALGLGSLGDARFSGQATSVPLPPPGMSPGEREAVRTLFGRLMGSLAPQPEITVQADPSTPGAGGGASPAPVPGSQTPADGQPQAPTS